jgi:DNA mismatch repair protein MutS2
MEVPIVDVEPVARNEQIRKRKTRQEREPESAGGRFPEQVARPEVDLRGLRTDEVEHTLLPAVDAAHVADLPALRIIHGKGTFAVRDEVNRLLDRDRRIAGLRPGGFEEGGSGVTVVEFRKGGV